MAINYSQDGSPSAFKKKNRRLGDWFNWHPSYAGMVDINTRPIQLATGIFKLEGQHLDLGSQTVITFFVLDTPLYCFRSHVDL